MGAKFKFLGRRKGLLPLPASIIPRNSRATTQILYYEFVLFSRVSYSPG